MSIKRVAYWITFTAVQVAGFVALSFTNVHSNIAPLFAGMALLLPGGVLLLLFNLPFPLLSAIIVAVNFASWWGLKRWGQAEFWTTK